MGFSGRILLKKKKEKEKEREKKNPNKILPRMCKDATHHGKENTDKFTHTKLSYRLGTYLKVNL